MIVLRRTWERERSRAEAAEARERALYERMLAMREEGWEIPPAATPTAPEAAAPAEWAEIEHAIDSRAEPGTLLHRRLEQDARRDLMRGISAASVLRDIRFGGDDADEGDSVAGYDTYEMEPLLAAMDRTSRED